MTSVLLNSVHKIYIYKEPGPVTSETTKWTSKQAEQNGKAGKGVSEG